jgi:hypothetical protein
VHPDFCESPLCCGFYLPKMNSLNLIGKVDFMLNLLFKLLAILFENLSLSLSSGKLMHTSKWVTYAMDVPKYALIYA